MLTPHERELIDKDVARTFPQVFRDPQRAVVRSVLQCYAVRFARRNNAIGCVYACAFVLLLYDSFYLPPVRVPFVVVPLCVLKAYARRFADWLRSCSRCCSLCFVCRWRHCAFAVGTRKA